jgi:hypothetical protein
MLQKRQKLAVQSVGSTLWSKVHLEKIIITQLVKKFSALYGTQKPTTGTCFEPAESSPHSGPLFISDPF